MPFLSAEKYTLGKRKISDKIGSNLMISPTTPIRVAGKYSILLRNFLIRPKVRNSRNS